MFGKTINSSSPSGRPEVPCFRLPAVRLGTTTESSYNLSNLTNWKELSQRLPKTADIDFPWGKVVLDGALLTVKPTVAGRWPFRLPFIGADVAPEMAFMAVVNPDPKTIPIIEKPTPTDAPYQASDTDTIALFLSRSGLSVIGASRRGLSHIAEGKFRDDSAGCLELSDSCVVVAVADGAGSAKYSRKGSEIAIREYLAYVKKQFDSCVDNHEAFFKGLDHTLVDAGLFAKDAIFNEASTSKVEGERTILTPHDFNTTLLAAVVSAEAKSGLNISTFSIGDGVIAWRTKTEAKVLSACDSGKFAGETLFLTTESVWRKREDSPEAFLEKRVKHLFVSKEELRNGSLFLMTDGVSDPMFSSEAAMSDVKEWDNLMSSGIQSILEGSAPERNRAEKVLEWLNFEKATYYDDRTLVILRCIVSSETPTLEIAPMSELNTDESVSETNKEESK